MQVFVGKILFSFGLDEWFKKNFKDRGSFIK